jgi:hypothetical protein
MAQHVKVLGILHVVLGAFGILGALIVFALFGGAAGFISAFSGADRDAAFIVPFIAAFGTGITAVILILSIPGIIIGIGLTNFRPWARIWGIVLSAVDLIHIPFGTILGAYGLWVLLQPETEALFSAQAYPPPTYPPPQPPPRPSQGR